MLVRILKLEYILLIFKHVLIKSICSIFLNIIETFKNKLF